MDDVGRALKLLDLRVQFHGSDLAPVHPARTSQARGVCHLWDPASRVSRDTFTCTGCGHSDDADHNASVVILCRALRGPTGTTGAAGHCGEQHAPAGHARPAVPRTRAGRTREPLNPSSGTAGLPVDIEGCKESQQVNCREDVKKESRFGTRARHL
ncbi:zinc ribbon domain-containing protein [Streptomyces mirabilis]|uniref:zinc ribbon domain-containing protein n=1 Tax=Streptomyces mirabilis TaxID=68239 RepID=UPI0009427AD2